MRRGGRPRAVSMTRRPADGLPRPSSQLGNRCLALFGLLGKRAHGGTESRWHRVTEARRHRGTEKNGIESGTLLFSIGAGKEKARWRIAGLFDRRGQTCRHAIGQLRAMQFSPCLCGSVRSSAWERTSLLV